MVWHDFTLHEFDLRHKNVAPAAAAQPFTAGASSIIVRKLMVAQNVGERNLKFLQQPGDQSRP